jgi:Tfp pilus assembly pilus retraction ATPase PilT
MGNLFQSGNEKLEKGAIMNKYFHSRLFVKNQNVLIAVTGGTGSGKSYYCLSMMNKWYQKQFNEDFPIENVCFSIKDIISLAESKPWLLLINKNVVQNNL